MEVDYQELSSDNATLLENLGPEVFDNVIEAAQLSTFLEDPQALVLYEWELVDSARVRSSYL